MDLWDVEVGRSLWMWSSPPAPSRGCPEPCPDVFWISPRMGTPGFLGKLCCYLITCTVKRFFFFLMEFETLQFVLLFPLCWHLCTSRFPQAFSSRGWSVPAFSVFACLSDVSVTSASLQPFAGLGPARPCLSCSWELITGCSTAGVSQHCQAREGSLPLAFWQYSSECRPASCWASSQVLWF